ncbi:hypothetical protein [Nocardioides pocheonensis]|uniref:Uncharacterized protein n=1 Tax=Nocardioides pocheonensis TaxID=661485 RepID=A0A3N0GGA2_9ACTN|nr:hypothetical protein [Nocardioides pocheonensis]RNM11060.1 hypothetical protein EFL26_23150 [Nocardioides pocheonensis]
MRSSLLTPLGLVLVLVGLVWTAQGIGWLGGSPMTGKTLWAVLGPLLALAGAALAYAGVRRRG